MKIAFIGLGIMGKPMAKNLIKAGHELFVFDRNPAANEEMKAAGANICASSADTVKNVDLVITMLPNSPQVKSVMLEEDKLADAMPKTAVFIDCSSINPVASREIAAELEKRGIDMLDAPVSGGQPKAIDGTLSFMVGGKEEVFNRFKPVLASMGSSVVLCGGIGAGNVTKLCNQTIVVMMEHQLIGAVYAKDGAEHEELAMDIANSGVTIAGLIPWCIACAVPLSMLGVGVEALPYACLLYLIPLCYLFTKRFFFPAKSKGSETPV